MAILLLDRNPPPPPSLDTSASEAFALTEAGAVTTSGAAHPNEPSGFSRIANHTFSSATEDGWTTIASGLRTDWTDAPVSAPNYLRFTKSGSTATSFSPGAFEKNVTDVAEVYFHWHFRLSSTFYAHTSNTNKVGPFLIGTGGNPFLFLGAFGSGSGTLYARIHLQGCPPSLGGNDASGAGIFGGSAFELVRGTTYDWEVRIRMNTFDVADGIMQGWVNGTQFLNKTNAAYRGTGGLSASGLVTHLRMNAIHGGNPPEAPATTTYIEVDNFYASA